MSAAPAAAAAPGIKIRLAGVSKRFGAKQVLREVDLEVAERRKTVLIGPSASGKSVLLKCIIGLHRPEAGRIELDGVDTVQLGRQARIELMVRFGVLFQAPALLDSLPVWENVAFRLLETRHMKRDEAREIAVTKLRQVGLPADTGRLFPAELSGGMQKRVGIARAIATDPEILILDDPTAGLDPITTNNINDLIDRCVTELGATTLAVTGDMESARSRYDHLAMLHEGRIIWAGPTAEVDAADDPYLDQLIHGRAEGPIKMRLRAR